MAWSRPPLPAWIFASVNLMVAALLLFGVFGGLPVRWWVVDTVAVVIGVALLLSSAAWMVNASWSSLAVRIGVGTVLGTGLLAIGALVLGAAYVRGVTGAIGTKGVLYFMLAVALLLPYLVGYPALQLFWLRGRRRDPEQP